MTAVCTGALVAAMVWLAASTALVILGHLVRSLTPVSDSRVSGSRVSGCLGAVLDRVEPVGPLVIRRIVGAVLGLAVSAGAAGPAHADQGRPDPTAQRVGLALRHSLDGLALPDRVADADAPARTSSGPALRPHPATVVVAPGDSLWSISARLLGPGASDPEITAAWQRLHRANRGRLSDDPDLIVPGTALLVPDLHPIAPSRKVPPR